ncbi:MAG: ABC transporter permease [Clostridia bacterium]|nr:ABC transporter permease [Clostridia bacterium]
MKAIKGIYIAIIMLFLYLPIVTLMVFSFNESKSMFKWTGVSLKWYREMFHDEQILSAIWNTFSIALVSSVIATIIGVLACMGINAMTRRTQTAVMALNNIPLLNADIVTGISLMLSFIAFGFYLNWGTVLLAHITFSIPYVILSVMPKLRTLDPNLAEAAMDLGCTPMQALWKVIIPQIRPGIVSGALVAFTMSFDDFVISLFTTGPGVSNISIYVYGAVKRVNPTINALSAIIVYVITIVLILMNVVPMIRERKGKKNEKAVTL